ncbi:carbohydrate kinase family protein [uncultured Legionella sp.]|uniref:carbohydrate kinase family protein n=1 Tax=uncultured Legionella sp. TaxID=210934 RepID=UPI00261B7D22|nr:carbohydrate kinase family protein [uncultured Legionella sp.]
MSSIFCIGGANIDLKLKSSNALLLHTSNPVYSNSSFGGVARNVAHNLAKVTSNVHLQCIVGDDASGRALLEHIGSLGVNTTHSLIVKGKRTSQYLAVLDESGELFIGLADMNIYDEIDDEFITAAWSSWSSQSLVFLDTNLPSSVIDLILKRAVDLDVKICIDPVSAEKAKKIPYQLDAVFLLKPDVQEASILSNMPIRTVKDCFTAGRKLLKRGAKNIVISMGNLGYVLVNDTHEIHMPALEVDSIVDVSGAGDAFVSGILLGLQQNKGILESCTMGAKSAAQTIQSVDTVIC